MHIARVILIGIIIAAGVGGSLFIIKGSIVPVEFTDTTKEITKTISQIPALASAVHWLSSSTSTPQEKHVPSVPADNITLTFGKSLLYNFYNTDFTSAAEPNPATIADKALTTFDAPDALFASLNPVPQERIKISSDTSASAKIHYLDTLVPASARYRDVQVDHGALLQDVFQKQDSSSALRAAEGYKELTASYLEIAVPRDWIELHRAFIIHFQKGEILYRALADFSRDPLKSYMALSALDTFIQYTQTLQVQLNSAVYAL